MRDERLNERIILDKAIFYYTELLIIDKRGCNVRFTIYLYRSKDNKEAYMSLIKNDIISTGYYNTNGYIAYEVCKDESRYLNQKLNCKEIIEEWLETCKYIEINNYFIQHIYSNIIERGIL